MLRLYWRLEQLIYGIAEEEFFDRNKYFSHDIRQIKNVADYFGFCQADLLVLNLGEPNAMEC
jgi:hypothetical protein